MGQTTFIVVISNGKQVCVNFSKNSLAPSPKVYDWHNASSHGEGVNPRIDLLWQNETFTHYEISNDKFSSLQLVGFFFKIHGTQEPPQDPPQEWCRGGASWGGGGGQKYAIYVFPLPSSNTLHNCLGNEMVSIK